MGTNSSLALPANLDGLAVSDITNNAFNSMLRLMSVMIPATVTNIGGKAFYGSGLTNISIPASVTTIGSMAFSTCAWLTSITVQSGNPNFSSVEGVLFDNAGGTLLQFPGGRPGSYRIPDMETNIGANAFLNANVADVTFPGNTTSIEDHALAGCSGLVSVSLPNSVTNIGAYAFSGCSRLTEIVIPTNVISLGEHAFEYCTSLTSLIWPARLATIGDYAFFDCTRLTMVFAAGNSPYTIWDTFDYDATTIYVLPEATGWGANYCGMPVVVWNPVIQPETIGWRENNQFGFTVTGTPNLLIQIAASTDLASGGWTPLAYANLNEGSFVFSDPEPAFYPIRFYSIQFPQW